MGICSGTQYGGSGTNNAWIRWMGGVLDTLDVDIITMEHMCLLMLLRGVAYLMNKIKMSLEFMKPLRRYKTHKNCQVYVEGNESYNCVVLLHNLCKV